MEYITFSDSITWSGLVFINNDTTNCIILQGRVYVGAVMVLFIFVVMMLDINVARLREGFVRYLPLGLAVATIMLLLMLKVVTSDVFVLDVGSEPLPKPADYSNTKALGAVLYTDYVFAFEIAAVILLVATGPRNLIVLPRTLPAKRHSRLRCPGVYIG